MVVGAHGAYLPSGLTHAALNAAVTQATIGSTICRPGFTRSVRPAASYTAALKRWQLSGGYAIPGHTNPASYDEDQLIPLELGGSPTSPMNLWPEPWEHSSTHPAGFAAAGTGAQTKDRVEGALRTRVCQGRLTLAAAQHLISSNWPAAFGMYVGKVDAAAPTAVRS